MSNLKAPFRYDYVGSFLRPEPIKKARADFKDGKITGYHVITDGEFRRSY